MERQPTQLKATRTKRILTGTVPGADIDLCALSRDKATAPVGIMVPTSGLGDVTYRPLGGAADGSEDEIIESRYFQDQPLQPVGPAKIIAVGTTATYLMAYYE